MNYEKDIVKPYKFEIFKTLKGDGNLKTFWYL